MKKITLLVFASFVSFTLFAQEIKLVKTTGKSQVQWYPDRESMNDAKDKALELAKINALENAFGTLIIQGNTVFVENKKTGEKVETNTTFKMIGNTAVKGEIIQVLKTGFKETKKTERINRKKVEVTYINCDVTIEAKELTDSKIDIQCFSFKNLEIIKPSTDFYEGEDLFLYFKSPVNGFLAVFLDDGKQAQCLLPYRKMPVGMEEAMPITADKEYIFFSDKPQFNYFTDDFFAEDLYELVAGSDKDINRLYVIFSKQLLNKPILNQDKTLVSLDKNNFELPRVINTDVFQDWLLKIQQIRNDINISTIIITIEKKK
jgi:hypothetical protein